MPQPRVHVLVINWNGREHLDACFRSLLATPYENARCVLVDNASDDDSVAFVQETFGGDPRVSILALPENRGWSGGNNAGIRQALEQGADYVFLLNNDTAVDAHCLPRLVEAAEADNAIGALAPKILLYDHPDLLNSVGLTCSVIGACWDQGLGRIDQPRWNQPARVIGACGAAAFFRCAAIERAGLLPEDFDIYLDDLDLCLRIWQAGYEVWRCPEATVRHKFSATMGEGERYRRKYYLNVRNRLRILQRNFPRARLRRIAPLLALGECRAVGRALLDGEAWKARVHLTAWREALQEPRSGPTDWAPKDDTRYWPLVQRRPLFFPGVPLPDAGGWYAPTRVHQLEARPFGRRAVYGHAGGRLRVTVLGRYDRLGTPQVRIEAAGHPVVLMGAPYMDVCTVEAPAGPITITAERIFTIEQTGEAMDTGGWVRFEPVEP